MGLDGSLKICAVGLTSYSTVDDIFLDVKNCLIPRPWRRDEVRVRHAQMFPDQESRMHVKSVC